MLCADRNVLPEEVLVITGHPQSGDLMDTIRASVGLGDARYSVMEPTGRIRVKIEDALKRKDIRVILVDECVIPDELDTIPKRDLEFRENMGKQDWGWLDELPNSESDIVLCLKPTNAKVKLPTNTRVRSKFLTTPHRQGLQTSCMWMYYNIDNYLDQSIDMLNKSWKYIQENLKLEEVDKLPASKPLIWVDIKEHGWTPTKVMRLLKCFGVQVKIGEKGLFLTGNEELTAARRDMPPNWEALHLNAVHGLEAEV